MNIKFNVKGSEKQIKWCEDILKDFNEFMGNIKLEDIKNNEDELTKEGYELAEKIVNIINSEDAKLIIQESEFLKSNIIKMVTVNHYIDILIRYAKKSGEDENKLIRITQHMRRISK